MRHLSAFLVYRGPSVFNGEPILAVVTGIDGSSDNQKTGPIAQLWIIQQDEDPWAAQLNGRDVGVCGDCPLRHALKPKIRCYVDAWRGVRKVWELYRQMAVDLEGCCAALKHQGTMLRLGAYGDPAALPEGRQVPVERLVRAATGHTGYTHGWRRPDAAWLRQYCMASVETEAERDLARAASWRTFRAIPRKTVDPVLTGERWCGSVTQHLTCNACRACCGASKRRKFDVAILSH